MNLKQGGELSVFSQENIENELCHLFVLEISNVTQHNV